MVTYYESYTVFLNLHKLIPQKNLNITLIRFCIIQNSTNSPLVRGVHLQVYYTWCTFHTIEADIKYLYIKLKQSARSVRGRALLVSLK